MHIRIAVIATLFTLLLLTGCATDPRKVSQPAILKHDGVPQSALTLTRQLTLKLPPGLRVRPLPAGSVWDHTGSTEHGEAFRLRNGVFVIDAGHRHEALLTVADGLIVGLYLPFKHLMVPVSPPVPITPFLESKQ
ncbi:MAG: hypothetical protein GMKNLPBB_03320 [Myxococcota bacterium]|nr:hypothetical protein [Myxococcota bacterium]